VDRDVSLSEYTIQFDFKRIQKTYEFILKRIVTVRKETRSSSNYQSQFKNLYCKK